LYERDLDHFALLRLNRYLTGKLYRPCWYELGRNFPFCYRDMVEKLLAEACKRLVEGSLLPDTGIAQSSHRSTSSLEIPPVFVRELSKEHDHLPSFFTERSLFARTARLMSAASTMLSLVIGNGSSRLKDKLGFGHALKHMTPSLASGSLCLVHIGRCPAPQADDRWHRLLGS
jgi:hypothetical protein